MVNKKNKPYDKNKWIYEQSSDGKYRFVLGEKGTKPLICIGVNPSTASPEDLDPTMKRVKKKAKSEKYDGYIMLNLSPERATNPDEMDKMYNEEVFEKNISAIRDVLHKYEGGTIWASWGNLIDKRFYLIKSLEKIANIASIYGCKWVCCDTTNAGHPRHPSRLADNTQMKNFDIKTYLNKQIGDKYAQ